MLFTGEVHHALVGLHRLGKQRLLQEFVYIPGSSFDARTNPVTVENRGAMRKCVWKRLSYRTKERRGLVLNENVIINIPSACMGARKETLYRPSFSPDIDHTNPHENGSQKHGRSEAKTKEGSGSEDAFRFQAPREVEKIISQAAGVIDQISAAQSAGAVGRWPQWRPAPLRSADLDHTTP